ncbi:hypothetical protein ACEN9X_07840 [Mucilaginibacter sp. Mucisp86]|uniref:hypothetical protein n=1 Tax=Mucilaginibacter sp. Mucisp86 TaxID=3243060 RepID=UPI0039B63D46
MYFGDGNYYYLILILEAFCIIHSLRRGTQQKWLWILIVIPLFGCLYYIYSEILSNRGIRAPKINVEAVINPGAKIKRLEDEVRFTDTFANRVKLADAYLEAGLTDKALEIYQNSLTGAFAENEHVMAQLIVAYFEKGMYNEVIPIAKKLYKLPQFARSKAHILYAKSLELTYQEEQAENEFKLMKGRYSYFEPRYEYGMFLTRAGRDDDAWQIFTDMLNEQSQLSPVERKSNKVWFARAKDELKKLSAARKTA